MPQDNNRIKSSQEAKEYHKIKNFLFVVNLLISLLVLSVFIVFGLSIFLRFYLNMFFANLIILNGVFFIIFYLVVIIFSFPLDLFEGFILEHKFKLSRQNFGSWLKDYLKKNFITLSIALIVVECVYVFIGAFYNSWWVFAALLWLIITVIFTKVFPLIILPLFFKSRPLADKKLKERIDKLARKFNFKLSNIFILELSKKTIKANAMVTGMGITKRIYLSDTLLNDFSHEEIEIVVAHELAHNKNKDIYKHIAVSFLISILSFYVCDFVLSRATYHLGYAAKNDIANLPLFSLLVFIVGFFMLPFQNGFSRYMENNADADSIKVTANPKGFISMISKLGRKNLADFSPTPIVEFFLYDHPPISKRINLAKQFIKD
ncbi:MAG: M48 family metallopeptidase [Candidatus Omnitrophica bacterium]|nr:M48 family metallopeptidase [Candidatus Omnitrophota bacterium]MDD5351669.1 M48 family metallopeptidase [Candidatus Omnitrophota bacterium]MDD5550879.1 M48 family metallopeptidase [Candidatus Omnitrophota bacterium]